jgi:hypothetical protein
VSIQWKTGKLQSAEINNRNGGPCKVRYGANTIELSITAGKTARLNADLVEVK